MPLIARLIDHFVQFALQFLLVPVAGESWGAVSVDFAAVRAYQRPNEQSKRRQNDEHETSEERLAQRMVEILGRLQEVCHCE